MRLNILLAATAVAALCSGAAMAQTADQSHSTIPTTNDPTTRTDDACGANMGPKPCGDRVVAVPIPDDSRAYVEPAPAAEPVADTSTSQMYSSAPTASPEVRTVMVTNGPVPDTPENRARFGGPESNGGRNTRPVGN